MKNRKDIRRILLERHALLEGAAVANLASVFMADYMKREHRPPWFGKNEMLGLARQVQEEARHFQMVLAVMADLFGACSVNFDRSEELLPRPTSIIEYLCSGALTDRAGRVHMESLTPTTEERSYARCIRKIITQERAHGDDAFKTLIAAAQSDVTTLPAIEAGLRRYAAPAYRCLGRPGSEIDQRMLNLEIKNRSAAQNRQIFEHEVGQLLAQLGLPHNLLHPYR